MRDAIIDARVAARDLNREELTRVTTVPRVRSVTVTSEGERGTVGGFNFILPVAFTFLLFMGVMGAGQGMLTTTVEEKSSRVIEVLLSAVSPLELMGGKLLGHMGISLLAMSLYLGLGLITLASFSLFGLLDLSLIGYLFIFFLIAFFTIGSLMMAAGAAVNDMREAQQLMMPMTLVLIVPWMLWMPISRNPDSVLAVVVSFLPPLNTFGMLMRLASTSPPPAWQVWLSIAIGIAGVFGYGLGHREGVPHRPAHVRQAAGLQDAREVGASGVDASRHVRHRRHARRFGGLRRRLLRRGGGVRAERPRSSEIGTRTSTSAIAAFSSRCCARPRSTAIAPSSPHACSGVSSAT